MVGLDILIFETINASQIKEQEQIQEKARKGSIPREQYVKEKQQLEYNTMTLHHEAVQLGIKELGWPQKLDSFREKVKVDFETAWNRYLCFSKQSEIYRNQ